MKEHNPDNPILHEAVNGTPVATPPVKTPNKKRDLDTMINGFQGDSSATRSYPIPKPTLERDFQMSVQLNPKISVGPGIWGQRNWIGYISGHWNGRWGKGTVVVSLFFHLLLLFLSSPFEMANTDKNNNNDNSLVVKTPSSSPPTSPPTWTRTFFSKPTITLRLLSLSELMGGASAHARR